MHKCQCGHEFEGNFCPNCGSKWQEEKTCPKCGTKLKGSAKFCSECGYTFTKTSKIDNQSATTPAKNSPLNIFIAIIMSLVLVGILLGIFIPICSTGKVDGTYYKLKSNGETDKATYFIIKSGKWEDEDGESGTYKLDGDKITFFVTFFGETEELCDGTIADGKLTINGVMGEKEEYVTEDYKGETKKTSSAVMYVPALLISSP